MVKAILLVILFSVMFVTDGFAGFLVKRQAPVSPQAVVYSNVQTAHAPVRKHAFLMPRRDATLPMGIYIAFCILPLGWLAIAINENFTQQTWIFSFLLYLLGYIPGVLYSFFQMHKYYK